MSGRRAVFVDRDGVINELVPDSISGLPESPLRTRDVVLIDGAGAALRRLAGAGFLLVGVSNQPAAAKGKVPVEQLAAVQSRVLELLAAQGVRFDEFRICLHHPDGVVSDLSGACACRKPAPGMLLDAARTLGIDLAGSWMIGDTDGDIMAGKAAGCKTILVRHRGSEHKRGNDTKADILVPTLDDAATLLSRSNP
ncbi:MAG: D-glycero-alpha-D-manno-heptose-1,7-bisphosphate 7-phosphatase [Solirubrobacteraceae bacterium]